MKKLLGIGGASALLVLCVLLGAFFAGPLLASAQTGQNTTTTAGTPTTNPYCEQYLQDLANRLHVSLSTLEQARLGAREDVLAQLVKDGKLTQAQANTIKQRLESHQACTGKGNTVPARGIILKTLQKYAPDLIGQVAQGLNLTPAQLQAQIQQHKTLSAIATAQHISSSQLHTIVLKAIQNTVNKAVSAGDLTQQQGSAIVQYLQAHPAALDRLLHKDLAGKK